MHALEIEGDPLAQLLIGRYRDPQSGELLSSPVRSVVIEHDLRGREVELISDLGFGSKLAVVGDDDTYAAMGERVASALASRFTVQRLILGHRPHADHETLQRLLSALDEPTDAIITVGSGTLNDLCKLASRQRGCPQAVFATAPSMNGYASVSASVSEGGIKRSIRAVAPVGVFFDLSVLAAAPPRLIRAGLGDSLCRSTAQADWLLAHLLLDQPYREAPFAMLASDEAVLVAHSRALMNGDIDVMRSLARTLVLSGFGMTLCGGSYPASQGEHLISHYMEMTRLDDQAWSFHGEQIAVTSVAMARLQHHVLRSDTPPRLSASRLSRHELVEQFGPVIGESCWREVESKCFDAVRSDELNHRLHAQWPELRTRIAAVTLAPERLVATLAAAGAPTAAHQLGWSEHGFSQAVLHARGIRDRYTFLDLAADSGFDLVAVASAGR